MNGEQKRVWIDNSLEVQTNFTLSNNGFSLCIKETWLFWVTNVVWSQGEICCWVNDW